MFSLRVHDPITNKPINARYVCSNGRYQSVNQEFLCKSCYVIVFGGQQTACRKSGICESPPGGLSSAPFSFRRAHFAPRPPSKRESIDSFPGGVWPGGQRYAAHRAAAVTTLSLGVPKRAPPGGRGVNRVRVCRPKMRRRKWESNGGGVRWA